MIASLDQPGSVIRTEGSPLLPLLIRDLQAAAAGLDYARARSLLTQAVTEYRPTNGIDDLVWLSKNGRNMPKETDSVIPFPGKKG